MTISKNTKKLIVIFVASIALFSLIFGTMIMLFVPADLTQKTSQKTEETQVYKEMLQNQNQNTSLVGGGVNNTEIPSNNEKITDLNQYLENVSTTQKKNTTDTKQDESKENTEEKTVGKQNYTKEEKINILKQSELLSKYDLTAEQVYALLYDLDSLDSNAKEIRSIGKKFEDMQKDPEYKEKFSVYRVQIDDSIKL